jgi:hypothetical protein
MIQHDSSDTGSLPLEGFLISKWPSPAKVPLQLRTNGDGWTMFVILVYIALWFLFLIWENITLAYGQRPNDIKTTLHKKTLLKKRHNNFSMGKVQYSGIQTHLGANQSELVKEWARNRKCDLVASVMSVYYYSLALPVFHTCSHTLSTLFPPSYGHTVHICRDFICCVLNTLNTFSTFFQYWHTSTQYSTSKHGSQSLRSSVIMYSTNISEKILNVESWRESKKICPWHLKIYLFCLFFGWLECVGHSFIRKAAIASRRATPWLSHPSPLLSHPSP